MTPAAVLAGIPDNLLHRDRDPATNSGTPRPSPTGCLLADTGRPGSRSSRNARGGQAPMPRRNYDARKGRRRPSDPRGEYSRAQVAQLTDRYVIRPKHPDRKDQPR
jgi:hypothetical protein